MSNIDYRELLRRIPLYNKYGPQYPSAPIPRYNIPEYRLQQLPPVNEMIDPWLKECDEVIQDLNEYSQHYNKFNDFYQSKYMSSKPPGMTENNNHILSPSVKK